MAANLLENPEEILEFLVKYQNMYDFQWTRIFCDRLWEKIPSEWLEPLSMLSVESLNQVPFGYQEEQWPTSLKEFINTALRLSIARVCTHGLRAKVNKDLGRGMSPKKLHEVEQMAAVVNKVCSDSECSLVVDVGSGLGYLGQVLNEQYGLQVLGLESKESNTQGAHNRLTKLSKASANEIQLHTLELEDSVECFDELRNLICQTSQLNQSDTRLQETISVRACIIGLHCCANLSPTFLKTFLEIDEVKSVVCVGCCYHNMKQNEDGLFQCFPLSQKLSSTYSEFQQKYSNFKIGVFGLRLAAQETRARWRDQTQADHNYHTKHVAYRALLELFFEKECTPLKKTKRKVARKSDFQSFSQYLTAVYGRIEDSPGNKDFHDKLLILHDEYEPFFKYIEIITVIQVILQPVIESLVVRDRCQYLREHGIIPDIIALFDEMLSPRNLAIVAKK